MSEVKELYLQTEALMIYVQKPFPKDDDERDAFLEKLDEQLAKRDDNIKKVDYHTLTADEKKLGEELLKLNEQLTKRMDEIRQEIRTNINQLEVKKTTSHKYENPYEGPTADGIFFDKRE